MDTPPFPPDSDPQLRVLALDGLSPLAALLPAGTIVDQANFAQLDLALLRRFCPDRVMLPLLARNHDAIQVIERLEALGYRGAITVIGPSLPHPRMVERELRSLGPGVRLVLLTP